MAKLNVKQILELIPDTFIETLEEETKVNYQVKKMSWWVMFRLLMMWILDWNNLNQRALAEIYNSPEFSEYADKWQQKTKHTTISDRLKNMNYIFFERLFEEISTKFGELLNMWINKTKLVLKRFDSTLVWLSEKLLKFWIKAWSPKEKHIKFTVWLEWYLPSKVKVFEEQKASSEEIALWETILEEIKSKNEILLFDRWVQKRETFSKLIDKDIDFVSRLKENARYTVVRQNKEVKWRKAGKLTLESDEIVKLYWKWWKILNKEFRVIRAINWKERYLFITNMLKFNAREITEFYARRWDIEVFFRFIKQEFWFSHFVSRSKNWIMNMLYITLITSILIIVYKSKNKIDSYKEAKRKFIAELNELILIDLAIAIWWDIKILKERYLTYYKDS